MNNNNALPFLIDDMHRHIVGVTLPGADEPQRLCLTIVTALVNKLADFKLTYGDQMEPIYEKMALKKYGPKDSESSYGVFCDRENGRPVFAFNLEFARYDSQTERVVYKDPLDVLVKETSIPTPQLQPQTFRDDRPSWAQLIRYAIIEK